MSSVSSNSRVAGAIQSLVTVILLAWLTTFSKEKAPLASVVAESSVYPSRRTDAPATGLPSASEMLPCTLYVGMASIVMSAVALSSFMVIPSRLEGLNPNLLAVTV